MPEPTVLDYVKEKLAFWRKGTLYIPTLEELQAEENQDETNLLIEAEDQEAAIPDYLQDLKQIRLPWRPIVALVAALIAQMLLEPPAPNVKLAIGLYAIAFGLSIWAFIRREWQLAELPEDEPVDDDLRFRWVYILAGIPLALLTYITFKSGVFEEINVTLWILTVVAFIAALISIRTPIRERISRGFTWLKTWPKSIHVSYWTILVTAAVLIIVYFRVVHLKEVPPEMTSDHAEKLQDVEDILRGLTPVFFTRNTGREAFQFYLTALVIKTFQTGVSFLSLKIGTVAAGLAILPFIFLTGKELGNRRAGLLAMFLAGIAYWPNVISRVGLRFSLYPLFVAPALYYFLRGLRTKNRNDLIWSGIALGMGLHGYSPFRIVPLLIVVGIVLYVISIKDKQKKLFGIAGLVIIVIISFAVFLPLFRYSMDNPDVFYYRALTRVGTLERPLPGSAVAIFFSNLWNAMLMFGFNDGDTWLHSIPLRPALDMVSAALFYVGMILLLVRYILKRKWQDMFLILSIPILMLPSILSLAFPIENPALNRTAGALVPTFIIIGLALDGFLSGVEKSLPTLPKKVLSGGLVAVLLVISMSQNYNLVFKTYLEQYVVSAGNTTEIGEVLRDFAESVGTQDTVWIVGYPNWIDTRLPAIVAGYPIRDYAIWPEQFADTLYSPGPKLFILNPEDIEDLDTLRMMYPRASVKLHSSSVPGRDFLIMLVPFEN